MMGLNRNLNFKQMSLFGSPDEEAAVIGRSTASYKDAWVDRLTSHPSSYGFDPKFGESIRTGNWTSQDLHALDERPLSMFREDPTMGKGGAYADDIAEVGPEASQHTVAHEIGHHLHLSWDPEARSGMAMPSPWLEGTADGVADRVTDSQPVGYYDRYFGSEWNYDASYEDNLTGDQKIPGPGEEMLFYTKARHAARTGQFSQYKDTHRNYSQEHMDGQQMKLDF